MPAAGGGTVLSLFVDALLLLSLADASITGVFRTPLLQTSVEIGAGMTIDAYGKHGLVISGIDTATKKHTAYLIDPNKVNIISLWTYSRYPH